MDTRRKTTIRLTKPISLSNKSVGNLHFIGTDDLLDELMERQESNDQDNANLEMIDLHREWRLKVHELKFDQN
jgi:hypothetical protein